MTTLFEEPPTEVVTDPAKEYLPDLVGEGKKFKTPEDLAKGKIEADSFIERLKTEAAELRQDLATRIKYEEFIDKMTTLEKANGKPEEPTPGEPVASKPAITEEDIASTVDKLWTTRETQKVQQSNLEYVKSQLQEKLGPDYANKLSGQAKLLGLSQKDVDHMAATTPKAFLQLFTAESKPAESLQTLPPTRVNTASFKPNGQQRTQKYYQDLKAKDPKAYFSKEISNEMHREALRQGEAFFDGA